MNRRCLNCMHIFQVPEEYKDSNCICPFCGFIENTPPSVATHLPPGVLIKDRYEVGTVIGAGGFGITYRTWDRVLDSIVCVKEYFPQGIATRTQDSTVSALTSKEMDSFERGKMRFLNEARNLAKFNALAGTVSIYDFFEANGTAYIVMEYLEGCNMKDYTKVNGSIVPFDMLQGLAVSICDILVDLHKAGLIHRDISPDNIFLCNNGSVKLIDFGAAKQEVEDTGASSTIILKHGYAPIEQYSKSGKIGPWTDIYSVGATLYKLATGVTVPEAIERVTDDTLVLPNQLNPMLPRNFSLALMKALAVQAKDRFQNVSEFRNALVNGSETVDDMVTQAVYPSDMIIEENNITQDKKNIIKGYNNNYNSSNNNYNSNNNDSNNSKDNKNKRNIIIASVAVVALLIAAVVLVLVLPISDSKEKPTVAATTEEKNEVVTEAKTEAVTEVTTEAATEATTEAEASGNPDFSSDGKVLNIHCWNDEFANRLKDHYPGFEANDPDDATAGGKIGDIEVKFTVTPSADNAYQDNLDGALPRNKEVAADDKVDIFLVEADYALKYVDTDLTMPVSELGIDVSNEFSNQYQYTKDIVTDANGQLKGVTWQGCPGVLIYNRAAAKEVLGSDDPDTVQAAVKDWDTYNATAAEMYSHGYKMTATSNDSYRVFSNNVSTPWVVDGKIQIDDNVKKWAEMTKQQVDAGYTSVSDLWSDEWGRGFYPEGKVFCYFGPAWFVDYCMDSYEPESIAGQGGWGAVVGPQSFYWGGTWMCAASGTDNPALVADIMRKLTTDEDIMLEIVKDDNDFVNNKPAMEAAASDDNFAFSVLGGQNPLAMFCEGADKIDMSKTTEYDQGCNESFQSAMMEYFSGNISSYDEAVQYFYSDVSQKYPELSY